MKNRPKADPFLKKYARLALGAGVAAGVVLPAQAQNPPAGAEPPPAAGSKATGGASPAGQGTQVPISVVYGPPPARRGVGDLKSGSRIGAIPEIAPPKKAKPAEAAGDTKEGAAKTPPPGEPAKKP